MIDTRLNRDGSATLRLGNEEVTLSAAELSRQIDALATLRAQMLDTVPTEIPAIVEVVPRPAYAIRTDRVTRDSLLSLRHPGLGWLHFELGPEDALTMRRMWTDIVMKLGLDPVPGVYDGPERRGQKPH